MSLTANGVWRWVRTGPVATLVLALLAGVVLAWPDATLLLELDRVALAQGEIWRIVTGHLTHYSPEHLAYDVLALLVLGIACERLAPWRTRAVLAASSLGVTAAVLAFAPDVERYRGLSGLDSALFALLVVLLLRSTAAARGQKRVPRWIPLVAAALFAAKLAYEVLGHGSTFVDGHSLFRAVPVAHVAGALLGLVGGLVGGLAGDSIGRESPRQRPSISSAAASTSPAATPSIEARRQASAPPPSGSACSTQ